MSAVDAAVMVIDAAKGIESQTRKLFEVCRLRDIPIITFINKIDREGQDPLALLDEISSGLALDLTVLTWPIGMGVDFRGCLDVASTRLLLPDERTHRSRSGAPSSSPTSTQIDHPIVEQRIAQPALESLALCMADLPAFDAKAFREGHLSPVIFGSALKDFGVAELLECLARLGARRAAAQDGRAARSSPEKSAVSGFVFKVQANMDPNHRDRVAFVRLCSGKFRRGMKLFNVREQQADERRGADLLLRAAARDDRRGLSGRHHRHPQPRHAAGRRHADRGRGAASSPAFRTSRRRSCGASCCRTP